MPIKSDPAYAKLVSDIACDLDPNFDIDERDLPALSDDQLAVVVNHEEYVALDSFNASLYADTLNSAVHLTEADKALAFWREFSRAARHSAASLLVGAVNEELIRWREPDNEPRSTSAAEPVHL